MSKFIYPRLPLAAAKIRIVEIAEAMESGGRDAVLKLADAAHPRSAPVATGGRVADPGTIADVRRAVLKDLEEGVLSGVVTRMNAAAFDVELGRTLHRNLAIVPADASHVDTWSFLTLVVFPDIAVARFPNLHMDRLVGTPRNVLRRTWLREEFLGDLLRSGERPLGEDELVGMFERSALARNQRVVQRLAVAVLSYKGPTARSEWARELYKRVTYATGPRLLDALTDSDIDLLIHGDEQRLLPE
ncbi:hypothetical protein O7621_08395 [Solwaraspora sp. WMMD937]|uniref:hypothetical protein n=1 Tax=Solwaraspora sp. WMMD937 TaxID=3016090 RepID=UPI00249A933E|nr:hypothetical protein [Solwaraspora sp. WMMD937]WFE23301.1 hypothetical protein O7621_08395 [Solwaraspora sp. WMMD937]